MEILRLMKAVRPFSLPLVLSFTILLVASLVSCGNDDVFTVQANVEGLGTQNVRIIYRDGDRQRSLIAMALDGKFSFTGVSRQYTIVDIYTTNRALLGSLVAKNGDNIELTMKLNEPASFSAKGNKISEELTNFLSQNKDLINNQELKEINAKVAEYVRRNPDNPASAFLLFTRFTPVLDKLLADSLIHSLNEERRPAREFIEAFTASLISPADTLTALSGFSFYNLAGDSVTSISYPGKKGLLLALVGDDTPGSPRDSVTKFLNLMESDHSYELDIIEISIMPDTAAANGLVKKLEPKYKRGWVPTGIASPMIESVRPYDIPWFIVSDSTGKVIYTGNIFQEAIDKLPVKRGPLK